MILLPAEEEAAVGTRPDKVRPGAGAEAPQEQRAVGFSHHLGISVLRGGLWNGETQNWLHLLSSGYK
jgi:hypothetical protein